MKHFWQMKAERIVLNSNVLISAALRREGRQCPVVVAARKQRGLLLLSDDTFDELRTRLRLPKFDRWVSSKERAIYLAQLEAVSEWVPVADAKPGCWDSNDDKLLETALMGTAGCLVSGDWDLLDMPPFQNIPILSPTGFLDLRTVR